jgi:hypothetical protein
MGAVEGQMASVMIEAFEKRIRESHTRGEEHGEEGGGI